MPLYPQMEPTFPELTAADKKKNEQARLINDGRRLERAAIQDKILRSLPQIEKDYAHQSGPVASEMRAIVSVGKELSKNRAYDADAIPNAGELDTRDWRRGQNVDSAFEIYVKQAYEKGHLDTYLHAAAPAAPAVPTVASAPAPAPIPAYDPSKDMAYGRMPSADPDNCLTPEAALAARSARIERTEGQRRGHRSLMAAQPNAPTLPAVHPAVTPRSAVEAFMDGVKPGKHHNRDALHGQVEKHIEKAAATMAAALKGTELDRGGQPLPEGAKLIAADGPTRAAYMMMVENHGGAALASLADPAKLKALLDAKPDLAKQFATIAHNTGQVTADGAADLDTIAKSFARREQLAKTRTLANCMPDHLHQAQSTKDVIRIAAARTSFHADAPATAVATTAPVAPVATPAATVKAEVDPRAAFARAHHMAPG